MKRRLPILAALLLLAAVVAAGAAGSAAARGAPAPRPPSIGISPAREFAPRRVVLKFRGERFGRTVKLPPRVGVRSAAAALRNDPRVAYAAPDYIATASGWPASASRQTAVASRRAAMAPARDPAASPFVPNDPGPLYGPRAPGGWALKQWNFLPWQEEGTPALPTSPGGIDAVGAWQNLIAAGRPGAAGITVAVLDTGIAYRSAGRRFRRSPDFGRGQFVPGYDFVANDRLPLDQNGHGTHVAGTIAEKTGNGIGLTGLAYGAKLMPVRVLDRHGTGEAGKIAKGIRFAVDHGADVINMSFNFDCGRRVPSVNEELLRAYRHGVVTVASAGNVGSESCVAPPATGPHVIGVGGTTEGGCMGEYSLAGKGIDVVAPGGGEPMEGCPSVLSRPIFQVTLQGSNPGEFGEPADYVGTSMAAAHVSGVAALTLASAVPKPRGVRALVRRLERRLRETARDIGAPATLQGAGLIDAARATDPSE
ncbi:MAG TPA: S8 family serine peptidase [Solirubrobacterales bacterium]|nr:S8 family serine peptidase [Solirubrobacterales bacterium]